MTALDRVESQRLVSLETVVDRGLETFLEVGEALLEIRNSRLYRAEFATFEEYCRSRWGLSRTHVNRTIVAAELSGMAAVGAKPTSERQARELAPLRKDPSQVAAAMREASAGGKPTAEKVRKAVEKRVPKPASAAPPNPAPAPSGTVGERVAAACAFIRKNGRELDIEADPERWLRQLVGTRLAIDKLIDRAQAARGIEVEQ